jgi:osmotically-inducible protein OsmY
MKDYSLDVTDQMPRSDADIYDAVLICLSEDERLDSDSMDILVEPVGKVTLNGIVDSFIEKQAAEELVSKIEGVLEVTNNLSVAMPSVTDMDTQTADDKRIN